MAAIAITTGISAARLEDFIAGDREPEDWERQQLAGLLDCDDSVFRNFPTEVGGHHARFGGR